MISEDLDENADPEVLKKCAEFFIDHDQFDKAVNLLVVARRVNACYFLSYFFNKEHVLINEQFFDQYKILSKGLQLVLVSDFRLVFLT